MKKPLVLTILVLVAFGGGFFVYRTMQNNAVPAAPSEPVGATLL
jgi:hypothetical protein